MYCSSPLNVCLMRVTPEASFSCTARCCRCHFSAMMYKGSVHSVTTTLKPITEKPTLGTPALSVDL